MTQAPLSKYFIVPAFSLSDKSNYVVEEFSAERQRASRKMFHDPGECHMSDPVFVHHKRWHSVSFEELQKESHNFQRADLT